MPADRDALQYLARLGRFGMRLGLERMRAILARLGDPHRRLAAVHVAGTNGKGSTAAMLAEIGRCAGLRVGLYTSPHLVRFHERIVVDGRPISPEGLAEAFEAVRRAWERCGGAEAPTQFEFTTAMAFWHLAREQVDLAVIEVGLGGRLDATNVLERPELCVITPIGLDHTQVLGSTLDRVAAEKAGILKAGVPVVTAPQEPPAMAVITARAQELGCPVVPVTDAEGPGGEAPPDGAFRVIPVAVGPEGGRLHLQGPDGLFYEGIEVALAGRHQLHNAAVAAACAHLLASRGWPLDERAIRAGLARARWPGRLQVLSRRPWLVLDGAHNPAAARAVRASWEAIFGAPPAVLVLGMLAEKDVAGVVGQLVAPGAAVVATRPRSSRTDPLHPGRLAKLARDRGAAWAVAVEPAASAAEVGLRLARRLGPALVAGSLYLAGEILATWAPPEGIDKGHR